MRIDHIPIILGMGVLSLRWTFALGQKTCAPDDDRVACNDDTCNEKPFENCTIECTGSNSCASSIFVNSVVQCSGACKFSRFVASSIELVDAPLYNDYYYSEVKITKGGVNENSFFGACTCCDDGSGTEGGCPDDIPSCSNDDVFSLCSSQHLFRTCKDWGLPTCSEFEIPSAKSFTSSETCSEGIETVQCVGESCQGKLLDGCTVVCKGRNCRETTFVDSVVSMNDGSAFYHLFLGSVVELHGFKLHIADNQFYQSAVKVASGSRLQDQPYFGFCSCCDDIGDGGNCPSGVPSCTEDTESFCATIEMGATCAQWGNPICHDFEALEATTFVSSETCSEGKTKLDCSPTSDQECSSTIIGCAVDCVHDGCRDVDSFEDSAIACYTNLILGSSSACEDMWFYRSFVECTPWSCKHAFISSSAVTCGQEDSCTDAILARCSCCDGEHCPDYVPSCLGDAEFCGDNYLGRTCKEWGNPICKDVDVPSTPALKPGDTCSQGEDIVLCDEGGNGCLRLEAENCSVDCLGESCLQSKFVDSLVVCRDHPEVGFFTVSPGEACTSATFIRSTAICLFGCGSTTYQDSVAHCPSSCLGATFSECSCCDGDGCPSGVPKCDGNKDAICSSVVDGQTCACRGLPLCEDLPEYAQCIEGDDNSLGQKPTDGELSASPTPLPNDDVPEGNETMLPPNNDTVGFSGDPAMARSNPSSGSARFAPFVSNFYSLGMVLTLFAVGKLTTGD